LGSWGKGKAQRNCRTRDSLLLVLPGDGQNIRSGENRIALRGADLNRGAKKKRCDGNSESHEGPDNEQVNKDSRHGEEGKKMKFRRNVSSKKEIYGEQMLGATISIKGFIQGH